MNTNNVLAANAVKIRHIEKGILSEKGRVIFQQTVTVNGIDINMEIDTVVSSSVNNAKTF